ncbi:MAG: hypothetical protein IKP68_00480 [Clostridia bacterium]|nr:hypothetical protein [Clostridia bacterium]
MRNLTIKRRWALPAAFMKARVYIEDSESGDVTIRDHVCSWLGEIENGKEKTFEIPNEETRIFVIYDFVSMNFCVDMKKIPAGDDDVRVSGVCKLSLINSNPFRFDGDVDDEVIAVRTGGSKKGRMKTPGAVLVICVIAAFVFLGIIMGIDAIEKNTPSDFAFDGVRITLNKTFNVEDNPNFEGILYSSSSGVAVYIERDKFDNFTSYKDFDKLTVEEYAELIAEINEIENEPKTKNGIVWLENETTNSNGKKEIEFISFFKTEDSFWIVEFDIPENRVEKHSADIEKWAASVRFDNVKNQ